METEPSARPVRVAHVIWRLSKGGGVQTVVRQLAVRTDPSAIELHVVSARPWIQHDDTDDLPIDFHPLKGGFETSAGGSRIALAFAAARELRRIRPDVVQVHSGTLWLGVLASFVLPRTPFVLEVHDAPGSGRHGRLTDRIEGWWARLRRAWVLCHSTSVEHEVRTRWGIGAGRLRCFPLAVDLEAFDHVDQDPATIRSGLDTTADQFLIAAIGRMVPSKRFDLAVEAVAALVRDDVDAVLVMIGAGSTEDEVRETAAREGVAGAVRFPGARFDTALADTLRAVDAVISTSSYEGFGLTMVEAMGAARPTVCMAVGGLVDIVVEGETGFLTEQGDVAATAARLLELAHDPARAAAMGRAGRVRAEQRFSAGRLAENFRDLYAECAGRPRR